jgi:hypothetical protein
MKFEEDEEKKFDRETAMLPYLEVPFFFGGRETPTPSDGYSDPQVYFGGLNNYLKLSVIYESQWPIGLA